MGCVMRPPKLGSDVRGVVSCSDVFRFTRTPLVDRLGAARGIVADLLGTLNWGETIINADRHTSRMPGTSETATVHGSGLIQGQVRYTSRIDVASLRVNPHRFDSKTISLVTRLAPRHSTRRERSAKTRPSVAGLSDLKKRLHRIRGLAKISHGRRWVIFRLLWASFGCLQPG